MDGTSQRHRGAKEGESVTNQQIAERMVVSATVKSRAEEEDGFKLELDVPQFRSNYPTIVTRVREATAKLLAPRPEPYMVVLVRQSLKKDKQGTRPYDYYWGLEGLATPAETAVKAQEPPPLPDQRRLEIAWSQSVNLAVTTWGNQPINDAYFTTIEETANRFYPIILEGPKRGDAPATVATSTPSPAEAAPPTEAEWQKLNAWAKARWGMDVAGIEMILGKSEQEWTGMAKDAQDLLLAAKQPKP